MPSEHTAVGQNAAIQQAIEYMSMTTKEKEIVRLLDAQAEYGLTNSFIQYAYPLFSEKTKRKMNWRAFEELEFTRTGIPILQQCGPEFWMDMIGDEFVTMFGKRRTGKTTFTNYICYYIQDIFPRGMVVSKTEDMNGNYSRFFPESLLMDKWDEGLFAEYLDMQREMVKCHKQGRDQDMPPNWYKGLIILDDCIDKTDEFRHSHFLSTTATQGRHFKVMTFLNTQYTKALTPAVRQNCDIAVLLPAEDMLGRDALWECFGTPMQDEAMFHKAHDNYTEEYGVLVCDIRDPNKKRIVDRFFWDRAPEEMPPFMMCSPSYWGETEETTDPGDRLFESIENRKHAATLKKQAEESEVPPELPYIAVEEYPEDAKVPRVAPERRFRLPAKRFGRRGDF